MGSEEDMEGDVRRFRRQFGEDEESSQSARDAVVEAAKGLDLHIERYLTALLVYPTLPPDEKFLVELKWLNASLAALDAAERAGGT